MVFPLIFTSQYHFSSVCTTLIICKSYLKKLKITTSVCNKYLNIFNEKNNSSNGYQLISFLFPGAGPKEKVTMKTDMKNMYGPNIINSCYFKSCLTDDAVD